MEQVFKTAEDKMSKTVNALLGEYASIRAGRAIPMSWTRSWWNTTASPRR